MRNIVGQAVSGEDFFERPKEIKKLWKAIESGSHIVISAPRRVGKTSILYYLRDNPKVHYRFIYIITESIRDENEFYRRIVKEIADSGLINRWIKLSRSASGSTKKALEGIKCIKIGGTGIELRESQEIDYKEDLIHLLESLQIDERFIIMIDEFPQTIENIINAEGESKAVHFLQSNREIRHNTKIKKVQFIYTGSIGIENIVSRLNAVNLINDLHSVKVHPLSSEEAELFIRALMGNKNIDFDMQPVQVGYLIQKIQWLIPYYIQVFIHEIDTICVDENLSEITESTIDSALEQMMEHRAYFEHWQIRLRKAFKKEEYYLAESILNILSKNEMITSNEILDMSEKHGVRESYKEIIRSLVHDGYINNNDDSTVYRFNSPILRIWWYRNVAC